MFVVIQMSQSKMFLTFHFHHIHWHLLFPHAEDFKICDHALCKTNRGQRKLQLLIPLIKYKEQTDTVEHNLYGMEEKTK